VNICPITYELFSGPGRYSEEGLKLLSRKLVALADLPYDAEEQRKEAVARSTKMSIQGVQLKLSARLDLKGQSFRIVDIGGRYILKPQSLLYPELPENEDLSMRLADAAGVEVPLHGMVFSKDGSRTYFIKRFDRYGRGRKMPVEDFAQLSGRSRETKYDSSMEQVAELVGRLCTFPVLENVRLLRFTLVNYLIGNEDAHLKNFSLIHRNGKTEIAPAYDLVNTTIALKNPTEEIALPIRGRKRKLSRSLFLDYYAMNRLQLAQKAVESVVAEIQAGIQKWEQLIDRSFLSEKMKASYREVIMKRRNVLGI